MSLLSIEEYRGVVQEVLKKDDVQRKLDEILDPIYTLYMQVSELTEENKQQRAELECLHETVYKQFQYIFSALEVLTHLLQQKE